ncbi:MAG: hypothetical protein MMC23_001452 [Stictis urceolatum]|nr:hypothetical protein [Stictis urceolata]
MAVTPSPTPSLEVEWTDPVTVPTRNAPTRADWERYRDRIIDLYQTPGLTYHQIRATMIADHNFNASEKSYKDHLKTWGICNKHIPERHLRAIARKRTAREALGKQSLFILRGRTVSDDEATRAIKRRRSRALISATQLASRRSPTPQDMTVITPPCSPPPVLRFEAYDKTRDLLSSIQYWYQDSMGPNMPTVFGLANRHFILVTSKESLAYGSAVEMFFDTHRIKIAQQCALPNEASRSIKNIARMTAVICVNIAPIVEPLLQDLLDLTDLAGTGTALGVLGDTGSSEGDTATDWDRRSDMALVAAVCGLDPSLKALISDPKEKEVSGGKLTVARGRHQMRGRKIETQAETMERAVFGTK